MSGNEEVISALRRVKSYLDYGIFQPIQISAITALNETRDCVNEIANTYESRRNRLIESFGNSGWEIDKPDATMFIWAKIPINIKKWGLLNFLKKLRADCKIAASPELAFEKMAMNM